MHLIIEVLKKVGQGHEKGSTHLYWNNPQRLPCEFYRGNSSVRFHPSPGKLTKISCSDSGMQNCVLRNVHVLSLILKGTSVG